MRPGTLGQWRFLWVPVVYRNPEPRRSTCKLAGLLLGSGVPVARPRICWSRLHLLLQVVLVQRHSTINVAIVSFLDQASLVAVSRARRLRTKPHLFWLDAERPQRVRASAFGVRPSFRRPQVAQGRSSSFFMSSTISPLGSRVCSLASKIANMSANAIVPAVSSSVSSSAANASAASRARWPTAGEIVSAMAINGRQLS